MVAKDGIIFDMDEFVQNKAFFDAFAEMAAGGKDASELYDKYAEKYDYLIETIGYIEPQMMKDVLMPYNFPDSTRVIDFGCGTGQVSRHLRELGLKNFTGLDASAAILEKAKE